MSSQPYQPDVYDDSDLTPDEMLAAAASHLDDLEGWGAPGIDACDPNNSEARHNVARD